jgi:hypothetical protein
MRCVRVDGATSSRLLHPPYTAWHLSYVAIGAAATPQLHADRLAAALGAFLLGVSVCAHALHELNGRPLGTRLSDRSLVALAVVGLAGRGRHRDRRRGHGVGGPGAGVIAGAFLVAAYNLELLGGRSTPTSGSRPRGKRSSGSRDTGLTRSTCARRVCWSPRRASR